MLTSRFPVPIGSALTKSTRAHCLDRCLCLATARRPKHAFINHKYAPYVSYDVQVRKQSFDRSLPG